jgi:hypothetical protein
VTFAIDDDPAVIAERARETMEGQRQTGRMLQGLRIGSVVANPTTAGKRREMLRLGSNPVPRVWYRPRVP